MDIETSGNPGDVTSQQPGERPASEEGPPSWFADYQAKADAKLHDAIERIGKLNKRIKEFGETRSQGSEEVKPANGGAPAVDDAYINALVDLRHVQESLSSDDRAILDGFREDGASVKELSRIAKVLAEKAKAGAKSAPRQKGHAGTAAHSPADADVPTTPEEVHDLLMDPDRKRRFLKKYPDFDFQAVMHKAYL